MMRANPSMTAPVTNMIAVASVAVFLLVRLAGMDAATAYGWGFLPARIGQPDILDHVGLGIPALPLFLTPLGATFLHGGGLHLGFNMLILLFAGRQVEMVLGGKLTLVLYGIGAYAAAAGQWALAPDLPVPMVGASGAISALLAAYALLFGNREVKRLGPIPAGVVRMLWLGAGWILLQFLLGIASRTGGAGLGTGGTEIAIGAHIGGFIAGMILVRPLLLIRFGSARNPH